MSKDNWKIAGVNIFAASTITQNGTTLSKAINLALLKADGFTGIQLTTLSAGTNATVKAQVVVCATETGTYTVPRFANGTEIDNIVDVHADGQQYYGLPEFPIAPFMKVLLTELNTEAVTAFDGKFTLD